MTAPPPRPGPPQHGHHPGVPSPGAPPPKQRAIVVTDVVTIATDRFTFAMPVHGLQAVEKAGTLLATDGESEVRTPHDDCVLIMPTRRPKVGETAVRLGRYVD